MSLNQHLLKLQFKVDHLSLAHRIAVLSTLLLTILLTWFFLIYTPQANEADQVQQQITDLNNQTAKLLARNDLVLQHATKHDMDKLIVKYQQIQQETKRLDQQLARYHHRYVDDRVLAKLLYAMLADLHDIRIENFTTVVIAKPVPIVSPTSQVAGKVASTTPGATPPSPTPGVAPPPEPDLTHYSLSLKGNYFSIMTFLQRIEQLKWQLFWDKLTYQVQVYPQAIATIEFFTLKPHEAPVVPTVAPAEVVAPAPVVATPPVQGVTVTPTTPAAANAPPAKLPPPVVTVTPTAPAAPNAPAAPPPPPVVTVTPTVPAAGVK